MSKPIDKAYLMKDACHNCQTGINNKDLSIVFFCKIYLMEYCIEPCTLEDWAHCQFNREAKENPPALKPGSRSYIEDLKKLEFENRNKFYFGCQHYFKKLKKDIDPIVEGFDLDDKEQRKQAWLKVVDKFSEPVKGG